MSATRPPFAQEAFSDLDDDVRQSIARIKASVLRPPRRGTTRSMTSLIAITPAGESLLWFIIVLFVFGLIIGGIARLLVPGPTPLGLLGTAAAGVGGALLGGLVGRLLFGPYYAPGWIMSILGATLIVWLLSRRRSTYYY